MFLSQWTWIQNLVDFAILKLHAVPSGDTEFSLVETMSASFRLANKRQEKIRGK